MNVSLTPELEAFVHRKVESGMYNSASEVIRESLRLLEEKEWLRERRDAEIRSEVLKGLEQIRKGEGIKLNSDEEMRAFMQNIIDRGYERLEAKKRLKKDA